ncbi:PTS N-acetylgalactosamine IIA component [Halolactibacillus miurensis]|uniref:PTS N-acetylgalactosamine IIA component n=1 Tax=Halolactibacillus miurensis TaxID=306541 RepID=A0A1I6P583_9BACI|nr:PTS sugar transporter subunit IIA [Halolactibacillus miurensis]GEM03112.1 PTS N-acetylgalactosamine IIA component [Halolactibacillus miurensis]SFS35345.1 PTS system, N-acetylgalactosamine-specific IIA component [Halolactibacillus miurensis]
MAQLIVTGHANFSSGLLSSVKLITGLDEKFTAVDFLESMGAEALNQELQAKIQETNDDVLIFTDLPGGTPFNQSVLIKTTLTDRTIEVVSGTNLPMLVEASMMDQQPIGVLLTSLINTGQDNVMYYQQKSTQKVTASDDGI